MYWGKDHLKKMWKQVELDGVKYEFVKNTSNNLVFAIVSKVTDLHITEIEVERVVNNCPVMGIGRFAFVGCSNLKKVVLPPAIKRIGGAAFMNCKKLHEINIPDMLEVIDHQAFYNCIKLTDLKVPDSIIIADQAFYGTPLDSVYKNRYVGLTSF